MKNQHLEKSCLNLKRKNVIKFKLYKKNDRDNFIYNIDSIEIFKGNFNEIAILRKK